MITITDADLKKFAPHARREYVQAIRGGLYTMRTAGILDNSYRVCHFMAQCGHETDGFTIVRESLTYSSAKRIREVWPARFKSKTDAEMAGLVKNARALGDAVYMGRMGNVQPGDGYDYRGGGFLQTTGRDAVERYCKRLGLDPSPSLLDDPATTLQFACIEWQEAKCNACSDENDITKVSKAINTGSADSNVKPVGMAGRQEWFAKAWAIWGDDGKADLPPQEPMSLVGSIVKVGGPVLAVGETVRQTSAFIPSVPPQFTETVANLQAWKGLLSQLGALSSEAYVSVGAGGGVALAAYHLAKKYLVRT